jgi:regulator of CtrA degradation
MLEKRMKEDHPFGKGTGNTKGGGKGRNGTVLPMPKLYDEALALLAEAHDYFYRYAQAEQADMQERERVMYASEISRITMRLSAVMAWLMVRKAVLAGKIDAQDAALNHKLDCNATCLHQNPEGESVLPKRLNDLLDKSYELYRRVMRLDEANAVTQANAGSDASGPGS